MPDFDTILVDIGEFGQYQKTRFYLFCIPAFVVLCFAAYVEIFILRTPDHHCVFPELVSNGPNLTESELIDVFIPYDEGLFGAPPSRSKCRMYNHSTLDHGSLKYLINESRDDWNITGCEYGMWYDRNDWEENVVTAFNLVCHRAPLVSTIFSVGNAGGIIGMLVFATLQDRIGRKPTFFICVGWFVLTGFVFMFMPNWEGVMTMALLRSLVSSTCFQIPFLIQLELTGPSRRVMNLVVSCVAFSFATVVLAVIAYFLRTWKQMLIVTSIPAVFLFGYMWFIDESARWLLATGRFNQVKRLLRKMARINGVDIDEADIHEAIESIKVDQQKRKAKKGSTATKEETLLNEDDADVDTDETHQIYGFWTIFFSLNLTLKVIIVAFMMGANNIVYSGIILNIEHLGYNQYIIFGISAVLETVSALLCIVTERLGRIGPLCSAMVIGGCFSIGSGLVPQSATWAVVTCAIVSKLFITTSFDIVFLLAGELFPTVVRASGLGVASMTSKLMSLPTPFIVLSAVTIHRSMPMFIFGGVSITAGLTGLFLPETSGTHLVETLRHESKFVVGWKSFVENATWKFARENARHGRKVSVPND